MVMAAPITVEAVCSLTPEQQAALPRVLAQQGYPGPISYVVNKTLIAGLKITIGSQVIDMSVKYRLGLISQELARHVS